MKIVDALLPKNQYVPSSEPKDMVFIHHTVGSNAKGTISWWNQTPERIGTAFVIDRDGTIYRAFDESNWASHLGIKGGPISMEKRSIGIELVSLGGLTNGKFLGKTPVKADEVVTLSKPFRGFDQFHAYTKEQETALVELLAYLAERFPLIKWPTKMPNPGSFLPEIYQKGIPGLYSHTNVRADKSDIYPQATLLRAIDTFLASIHKSSEAPSK